MYPEAYLDYLVHFHGDRDYFECHEVLEEYWKQLKEDKRSVWVGLILVAVANYHYRRNNLNGAYKSLTKAIAILEEQKKLNQSLGLDRARFISLLTARAKHISTGVPYTSFNFPVTDGELLQKCLQLCEKKGLSWGSLSQAPSDIINRHISRDRGQVIQDRKEALKRRMEKKA